MNTKTDAQAGMQDTMKLVGAAALIILGVVAFYFFSTQLLVVRVLGLLVLTGIAVAIGITTERGANIVGYGRDSIRELRKVVWPSRQETVQTTLAVVAVVIVMGIFLWLLDMLLMWLVRFVTG